MKLSKLILTFAILLGAATPAFGLKRFIEVLAAGVTDSSNAILASGTVTIYDAGTTNLRTCYSDYAFTSALANPATLDAAGRLLAFCDRRVKLLIKNSAGTTIHTWDNVGNSDSEIASAATAGGITTTVPVGGMMAYGGASAPTGWLICDGSTVSQTDYAALYAIIGTSFNTGGEGGGTFRLPGQARRTLVGAGGSGSGTLSNTVGSRGGEETHTMTTGELVSHAHTQQGTVTSAGQSATHTHGGGTLATDSQGTGISIPSSGAHSHTTITAKDDLGGGGCGGGGCEGFDTNGGGDDTYNNVATFMTIGSDGAHTHTVTDPGHTHGVTTGASGSASGDHTHQVTLSGATATAGSSTAFNVVQPSLVVNFIIKY